MDRNYLPYGCLNEYPHTRVRRGKTVTIPKKWRGAIPQWPGTLERRHNKKVTKRTDRRKDKLRQRIETKEIVDELYE